MSVQRRNRTRTFSLLIALVITALCATFSSQCGSTLAGEHDSRGKGADYIISSDSSVGRQLGLKSGDRLLSVNGVEPSSPFVLLDCMEQSFKNGKPLTVNYVRGTVQRTQTVTEKQFRSRQEEGK